MIDINNTACFTGHRKLAKRDLYKISSILDDEILKLYHKGVKTFLSGGALGFDQIAASHIINFKRDLKDITLFFIIPYKDFSRDWSKEKVDNYEILLSLADGIHYISNEYTRTSISERNLYLVENSSYCINYLKNMRSGTGQTINFAKENNLELINLNKNV